jgi:hypothetical protein
VATRKRATLAKEDAPQGFRRRVSPAAIMRSYLIIIVVVLGFLVSIGAFVALERLVLEWLR